MLRSHFIFEAAAYFVSYLLYRALRRRFGDSVGSIDRWSIIAAAAAGAALGSRLLSAFENPLHPLQGGKTIVGGLIGGLIAVETTKRVIDLRRSTGDLFAVPIAIGIAIGRIGCFFTGLQDNTYGLPSTLPWSVDFGDGIPRHPVQLYESVFAMGLAACLFCVLRRPHQDGDVFKVFMVAYMAWRFVIDFLKPGVPVAGFTVIQWSCAVSLLYYLRDIARWCRREKRRAVAGGIL